LPTVTGASRCIKEESDRRLAVQPAPPPAAESVVVEEPQEYRPRRLLQPPPTTVRPQPQAPTEFRTFRRKRTRRSTFQ